MILLPIVGNAAGARQALIGWTIHTLLTPMFELLMLDRAPHGGYGLSQGQIDPVPWCGCWVKHRKPAFGYRVMMEL